MEDLTQVSLVIATNSDFPKGSVYLDIPGIGRVINILDEVFRKLRVNFWCTGNQEGGLIGFYSSH